MLVEAFGLLASEHHEVLLVLAGADGDDRPAINAAIDGLDPAAAQRVVMTGRIDEQARSWLLRNAAVLAYPSLDEGFGFPLLDAMQVGVPSWRATAARSPRLRAGRAAVAPDDADALAGNLAMRRVRRRALEHACSRPAATQLTAFSWQRCATDLAALYRRLAEEAR